MPFDFTVIENTKRSSNNEVRTRLASIDPVCEEHIEAALGEAAKHIKTKTVAAR